MKARLPKLTALLATTLTCCCAVVQAAPISSDRPSLQEVASQKALAECRVQITKPKPKQTEMRQQVVFRLNTDLPNDPLENYARNRNGEWQIHTHSSLDDPWIRLMLLTPERPVMVDVAVLLEGKSFREVRQRWVELLLSQAKGNYSTSGEGSDATEPELSEKKEPSQGTASTTGSSDEQEPTATSTEATEQGPVEQAVAKASEAIEQVKESAEDMVEAAEAITGVDVQRRTAPSVIKRLKNYVAAMGDDVDLEEIRWLLADWAGGPGLLVLGPATAWERAEAAPLWSWLDEDGDHRLNQAEVAEARNRLSQADINEDEIVELVEFYRSGSLASPYQRIHSHPLIVVLDEETDWNVLSDDLEDAYGESPHATAPEKLQKLIDDPPELRYMVSLDKQGQVRVLAHATPVGGASQPTRTTEEVIPIDLGGMYFELTAVYQAPDAETVSSPQIALGAAIDGYPLVRLLDADGDNRITRPEARNLDALLKRLDTNNDGSIDQSEIPTAVRLSVGNGPFVHEQFKNRAEAAVLPRVEAVELPDWFKNMDRNRDGELSRREFPGSPQQFATYDRDGNGIISGSEIQESDASDE